MPQTHSSSFPSVIKLSLRQKFTTKIILLFSLWPPPPNDHKPIYAHVLKVKAEMFPNRCEHHSWESDLLRHDEYGWMRKKSRDNVRSNAAPDLIRRLTLSRVCVHLTWANNVWEWLCQGQNLYYTSRIVVYVFP